jgi:flavodoxin
MKYAVIYYSESGNTEMLAKQIYTVIDSNEKILIDLNEQEQIPCADVYFVGFPIRQNNCSIKVVDALEQIETGKLMLFATCGLTPTEAYKQKLEETLCIWLPEEIEYLGMFLCQGRMVETQREYFYHSNIEYQEKLEDMFYEGENHPDKEDLEAVVRYVKNILP